VNLSGWWRKGGENDWLRQVSCLLACDRISRVAAGEDLNLTTDLLLGNTMVLMVFWVQNDSFSFLDKLLLGAANLGVFPDNLKQCYCADL
jgi:hypothetical protein